MLSPDARPSVLSSAVRPLRFDGVMTTYVDIGCTEPDLNVEFDEVIDDLLDTVDGSASPGAAALGGLSRWRRLFRTRLVRGLGIQARLGLFAELTVLRVLLDADPSLPVEVWTGPLGEPHDFEAPTRCLEIKATGAHRDPVTINGIQQLDIHDGRPLDLLILTVLADPEGATLTELIDIVRSKTGNAAGFGQRLRGLGWQPDLHASDSEPFIVAEVLRVPIAGTTPRIVPASLTMGALPSGISGVSYRIDRATLTAHSVPGSIPEIAENAVR